MARPDNEILKGILESGSESWNAFWRGGTPRPNANAPLSMDFGPQAVHDWRVWDRYDFSQMDFRFSEFRNGVFDNCDFSGSYFVGVDMCFAHFYGCDFRNASLRLARLGSAEFTNCTFDGASLAYVSNEDAKYHGCSFVGTDLSQIKFVGVEFHDCKMIDARVYGTTTWDVDFQNVEQRGLRISKFDDTSVTVDDLEIAQFIYLLTEHKRVRNVIDTITTKVVLILGRFGSGGLERLQHIRRLLSAKGFVPIVFDFEPPSTRNTTETVSTLAHLARFVLVDLSDPRCVPHELASIIPRLSSVAFHPIIKEGESPYGMFEDWRPYPWVRELTTYTGDTLDDIVYAIAREHSDAASR